MTTLPERPDEELLSLELSSEQVAELRLTLLSVLQELGEEITDTDNAAYRRVLRARRDRLRAICDAVATLHGTEETG